jgi:DNA/RNA-binding domain of Phe-tRNA-synthetase-like protein
MYTLDYDLHQLEQLHDRIHRGEHIRIIHLLTDHSDGFSTHYQDRYIVIIDCDPMLYTLLCLL